MEKDAYYFPHFSNARADRKLKRVIKELGVEGYGIYFMLLEVLRDQSDFSYPLEDIDLLADEFNTSEQKVRTVIANYKLFQVDEEQRFFSAKFNEYMQPYLSMKEQRRLAGIASGEARRKKALLLNECSTEDERVFNENEQSKVKESKVKESKVKESKVKESKVKENNKYTSDFECIYKLYPRPENKAQTFNNYKKALKSNTHDELIKAVNNYINKKKGTAKEYLKSSSNFFGRDLIYVDYLDENCDTKPEHKVITGSDVEYEYY